MSKKLRSTQIKLELDSTIARLEELRPEQAEHAAKYKEAEAAFIEKTISFEELQSAQNRHAAIDKTINTLNARVDQLTSDYTSALEAEDRIEELSALRASAHDAKTSLAAYTGARGRLDEAARLDVSALNDFRSTQALFAEKLKDLTPTPEEMNSLGITQADIDLANNRHELPALEFAQAIAVVERQAAAMRAAEMQAERERMADEARARNGELKKQAEAKYAEERKALAAHQQRWVGGNRQRVSS